MYPPVFSTKPDPMTLYVGKQATFQCVVTGSSPMTIVWHKDNIAISPGGSYQISSDKTKYTLQIKNLQLNDQGTYLCKASNSVGTATCSSELRVINKPSFIKTFEASVSSAVEPARILEKAESINVTSGESATLECKIAGKPPSFVMPPQPLEAMPGTNVLFSAIVKGSAPLKLKWFRGTKEILSGKGYEIALRDSTATMEEITKSDSGQYRCVATNKAGEIECNTDMHVEERKEVVGVEGDFRAKLKKTPSKQKSPQEEKDIDIVELLRNVDPKEYEKYARMYGITDYRGLLQAIEQLKREKAEESGRPVN
uniref:Ig-like domain-containing protein n=1 Tax=Salmo trutta TaxID=8032 RepID=A0A674CXT2_SALTR